MSRAAQVGQRRRPSHAYAAHRLSPAAARLVTTRPAVGPAGRPDAAATPHRAIFSTAAPSGRAMIRPRLDTAAAGTAREAGTAGRTAPAGGPGPAAARGARAARSAAGTWPCRAVSRDG